MSVLEFINYYSVVLKKFYTTSVRNRKFVGRLRGKRGVFFILLWNLKQPIFIVRFVYNFLRTKNNVRKLKKNYKRRFNMQKLTLKFSR